MQAPGEYPQPITRPTEIRVPAIAGFVTARLRPMHTVSNGTTFSDTNTQALIRNVGSTQVTVGFRESPDYTAGPFTLLPQATLKPGGQTTLALFPKQKYLELRGLTGTGAVSVRLNSQIQFEELGFDKLDPNASGYQNANYAGWSTL
jgi:hypothetical protein